MGLSENFQNKFCKYVLFVTLLLTSIAYIQSIGLSQGSPCQPVNIFGGIVNQIEIISINGQSRILAGGVSQLQGLLISADEGISWSLSRDGMNLEGGASIRALAVDELNPSHYYLSRRSGDSRGVYASQDEGNSWHLSLPGKLAYGLAGRGGLVFASTFDEGLWVSTDSGKTWENRAPSMTVALDIIFDPRNPSLVFFSTAGDGILVSSDSGSTFVQWGLPGKDIVDFDIEASEGELIAFAVTDGDSIFRSIDRGENWEALNNEVPGPWSSGLIKSIEIDPFNLQTVYAGTIDGIYRTTDMGENWHPMNTGLGVPSIFDSTFSLIPAVLTVAVDRDEAGVVYAGTDGWGLFRTADRGEGWRQVGVPSGNIVGIAVSPLNPGLVFAGTEYGLFIRRKGTWTPSTLYLAGILASFDALAPSPVDSNIIVTVTTNATIDNLLYVTRDGGIKWKASFFGALVGDVIRFDPMDASRIYVPYGGSSWGGVVVSSDTGRTWTFNNLDFRAIDIAIHPLNSDVLYLLGKNGGLLKSEDRAETWSLIRESSSYEHKAILIDPNNPDVIYLATVRGVYKSSDAGDSWVALELTESSTDLAFDPRTRLLYASTFGAGVFSTDNGGVRWSSINSSACYQYVNRVTVGAQANSSVLYIGTNGSGLFEEVLTLTDVAPSGQTTALPAETDLLQNYPNPFNSATTIKFIMAKKGNATIRIFDLNGRTVFRYDLKGLRRGTHTVRWDGSDNNARDLSSGIYFLNFTSGKGFSLTKKMMLLR